jgi:prevent-host-death family protein
VHTPTRGTRVRTATAKDLRHRTAAVLSEVRRGREVVITYRGKSVAVLAPVSKVHGAGLDPVGFGMWRGRRDMRRVETWLDHLRKPRYRR